AAVPFATPSSHCSSCSGSTIALPHTHVGSASCLQRTLAPLQRSIVQALPSSVHGVALLATTSGGQGAVDPEQCSATSHSPAVARHTVVLGWKPSAGQLSALPVHVSATSHAPALVRHSAPAA